MYYARRLQLKQTLTRKSCFLLGPRQTGKSSLLHEQFPDAPIWNLLDASTYRKLNSDPSALRWELRALKEKPKVVVIDEIQRIPELLNEVHILIEEDQLKFVLTGSSARTLRRKGTNLLAGRARVLHLHPLVHIEIGADFDLLRAFNHGMIPSVYLSSAPDEDLEDYCGVYLREEIAAEGISRNLPAFSRFLEVAALCNGTIINFTSLASDAQTKRSTVVDWFDVLKDTLIAHELPAWTESIKRKAIQTSKYYFFDLGVARHLSGQGQITNRGKAFGDAFEHFIFLELKAAQSYGVIKDLHYWRSTSAMEVDFVIDNKIAVEVKAKETLDHDDLKGLRAIGEETQISRRVVLCLFTKAEKRGDIEILPWRQFLHELWT